MALRLLQSLQREIEYHALVSHGSSYGNHINKNIFVYSWQ